MINNRWLGYLLLAGMGLSFPVLHAHEFWLEPHDFSLQPNEQLIADIKVGQNLVGNKHFFIPEKFEAFDLIQGENIRPVNSRTGDIPPVHETGLVTGLAILAYTSTIRSLRYTDAETFQNFLEYEGIPWVREAHTKRGLPAKGFVEIYRRYGKSLIKVGHGKGQDKALGLPVELIVLDNPYQGKAESIPVQLLWRGKPFPDSQVSVFFRPDNNGKVERSLLTTDAQGKVHLPRPTQPGMLLLNAVQMIQPDAKTLAQTGAVWESLWASTTFAVD